MNGVNSTPQPSAMQALVSPSSRTGELAKPGMPGSAQSAALAAPPKLGAVHVSDAVQIASSAAVRQVPLKFHAAKTANSRQIELPQSSVAQSHKSPLDSRPSAATFSLSQGPQVIAAVINQADPRQTLFEQASSPVSEPRQGTITGAGESSSDPGASESRFVSDTDVDPAQAEGSDVDVSDQEASGYNPFASEDNDNEASADKAVDAQVLREQAELEQLAKRDAEVRAHEQAHASVGGTYARSPSFKYEQGSDGRRYAVDGEVSIDISSVPGDPLATMNKMKQVYAAAMAPATPSMADIRVASEALRKINIAKSELAKERQQDAPSVQEIKPLIDAGNAIEGITLPDPIKSEVSGSVNANGTISAARTDSPSSIDDDRAPSKTIEQISHQTLASHSQQARFYSKTAIGDTYNQETKAVASLAISV